MLLLRTKLAKQSQMTAEKVPGKFPNRKITVTPEIQAINTTKIRPKTTSCGIAGKTAAIPQLRFFVPVSPCR